MTADLLEYLARQGYDVTVYVHEVKEKYTRNGVHIQPSDYLSYHIARDADVFITHPEIRTGAWGEVRNLPYIGIVHNVNPPTLRSIERQPPTLTIANSHYTRHLIPLIAHNTGMGVKVIHPPVLIEPITGTNEYTTMVNISLEKGGAVLNYVASQNVNNKFLAVLGGHGLQVINQPPNVRINKSTEAMNEVYADTRVLMFPTHSDTYGKVVAEAMRFGIPVITSDNGGVREAAGDAAIYVDPYDYEGWNYAYVSLRDKSTYNEWAQLSRERGEYLYDRSLIDLEEWGRLVAEVTDR